MTPRQTRFLQEYRKDYNASAAARRMGYGSSSAPTVGYRLLHSVPVQAALLEETALGETPGATAVSDGDPAASGRRVLQELQTVAFAPGSDEKDAPVKLTSKLKALELLGKSLGLFENASGKALSPVTILEDL